MLVRVGVSTREGKLDLCYGSTDRSDRNGRSRISRVRSRNKTKVGLLLAKSFGADLEGNKSNHSRFAAKGRSIANEVKLKA